MGYSQKQTVFILLIAVLALWIYYLYKTKDQLQQGKIPKETYLDLYDCQARCGHKYDCISNEMDQCGRGRILIQQCMMKNSKTNKTDCRDYFKIEQQLQYNHTLVNTSMEAFYKENYLGCFDRCKYQGQKETYMSLKWALCMKSCYTPLLNVGFFTIVLLILSIIG